MKLSIAFFFLLSLLLLGDLTHGRSRKEEGEYWKKIMKEEALPEMLKELLIEADDPSSMVEYNNNKQQKEHFLTNFDPHPNAIIYHAHAHAHNSNPTALPNLSP
ncbi:uncharacterized protein LOC101213460 [Cucumis sativus]|uniref:Organ-specific protein P4 n=1 Tax=Cucumis sativus TaxID=3659 RepID=A0A0A0LP62_CUCSA|nr:uncharacterized protein LOC101213460 [Cucumis sativus]KGN61786.1 hypothetical protein Csa_006572 [Cucumis sativus]